MRENKTKKQEQQYDGTEQGTYKIEGRKRGTDVGKRGGEKYPIRKYEKDKHDTQEKNMHGR